MKICAAQMRPVKGDIQTNIEHHKKFIDLALSNGAEVIIFPELSITGYEPTLAKALATLPDDPRFDDFQNLSNTQHLTIAIGVPTKNHNGICISLVVFQPHQPGQTYSKKYLHVDEEPFFVSGQNSMDLIGNQSNIAFAICYEISVPEHAENAYKNGAEIYLASVAKTAEGVEKALTSLPDIAAKYSMTVMMANSVGHCDNFECAGTSAAWNNQGRLLAQLNDSDEGIIILDTDTQEVITRTI
ncbi:MAG: carbon-nitrogen hydrolase family protein [Acidobacteriota bacterium]